MSPNKSHTQTGVATPSGKAFALRFARQARLVADELLGVGGDPMQILGTTLLAIYASSCPQALPQATRLGVLFTQITALAEQFTEEGIVNGWSIADVRDLLCMFAPAAVSGEMERVMSEWNP